MARVCFLLPSTDLALNTTVLSDWELLEIARPTGIMDSPPPRGAESAVIEGATFAILVTSLGLDSLGFAFGTKGTATVFETPVSSGSFLLSFFCCSAKTAAVA